MEDGVALVENAVQRLFASRGDTLALALHQRARFDGWLKWELATGLRHKDATVRIEHGHHDLFLELGEEAYFIELRTVPTSFRVMGAEQEHKRTANDLDAVLKDLEKVASRVRPPHTWGLVVFCLFPVHGDWAKDGEGGLDHHLEKIEERARLPSGSLALRYAPVSGARGGGLVWGLVAPFKHELEQLIQSIIAAYQPQAIYLYGSLAWGKPNLDSDIDLLLVKETRERPIDRRITAAAIAHTVTERIPMDILVYTPGEIEARLQIGDQFVKNVVKNGVRLYAQQLSRVV